MFGCQCRNSTAAYSIALSSPLEFFAPQCLTLQPMIKFGVITFCPIKPIHSTSPFLFPVLLFCRRTLPSSVHFFFQSFNMNSFKIFPCQTYFIEVLFSLFSSGLFITCLSATLKTRHKLRLQMQVYHSPGYMFSTRRSPLSQ